MLENTSVEIKVAIIAAITSVVGAITSIVTVIINRRNNKWIIDYKEHNEFLKKNISAIDVFISSIQYFKDDLLIILSDPEISIEDAYYKIRVKRDNLIDIYDKKCSSFDKKEEKLAHALKNKIIEIDSIIKKIFYEKKFVKEINIEERNTLLNFRNLLNETKAELEKSKSKKLENFNTIK